jgi:uncharacterized cofD-like protein
MSKKTKKIVCIGGGTGVSMVLSGLKKYPLNLAAIVTVFDTGGSSGKMRRDIGILSVGDARASITCTASAVSLVNIFNLRDEDGDSVGNYLIVEEERKNNNLQIALDKWRKKLKSKAEVFPVTLDNANIKVILKNGDEIIGEENIINSKDVSGVGIEKLVLSPEVEANQKAILAIKEADLIIIGPGKFYTSVIPNLLVKGIPEAIRESKAKKVFICNLMTQEGNTDKLKVEDYVSFLEKYLGTDLDFVIYNTAKLDEQLMEKVKEIFPKSEFVKCKNNKKNFIGADLLDDRLRQLNPADILVKGANQRTIVFHDSQKLAEIISKLCK